MFACFPLSLSIAKKKIERERGRARQRQCVCMYARFGVCPCFPNNKSLDTQSDCTPVAPESEAPDATPLGWCPTHKGESAHRHQCDSIREDYRENMIHLIQSRLAVR